jgi:hypothetical protein
MILRAARKLTRPLHYGFGGIPPSDTDSGQIPYLMFDQERTEREVKAARHMSRIYHKGQEKAWEGEVLLAELLEKHGGVNLAPDQIEPVRRLFAVIFWGEMAAWKVSAELALELEPLEAKMAATSQAHDEARHFYVLHDYLKLIGYTPSVLPTASNRVIQTVLQADTLAKKLMGMQLMVEPIALSLFQMVRRNNLEPVLCDLLEYYERDEARHVALGVQYLPTLLGQMSKVQMADFYIWQIRLFLLELDAVIEMAQDFKALGFSPQEAIRIGELKQLHAARMLRAQMNADFPFEEVLTRVVEARMALSFPPENDDPDPSRIDRWRDALHALVRNTREVRDIQEALDGLNTEGAFPTEHRLPTD